MYPCEAPPCTSARQLAPAPALIYHYATILREPLLRDPVRSTAQAVSGLKISLKFQCTGLKAVLRKMKHALERD
ncbi:hypothetical protein L596_012762 [Steinernema carpocapsae]|uniref:Uncharacterized protein n=1 Tax=Steinernema carpocapsae TaxID=34508 RepID=A0A4V6A4Z3_STECR|nr:hypothetical protein L596_012762 [Steinernema carpocapsae]